MARPDADPAIVIYHISPWRMWLTTGLFIALGALLLLGAAGSAEEPDARNAFFLTALFIFGCACLLYVLLRYTRLELSVNGIKLYQFGYTLETTWDNIAALYDGAGAEG